MGDSYASLLERIEVPQPSMQRFAVIAIFEKLRSAPSHLGIQSEAGREALIRCLHSSNAAVVDQAVRQLCLLVQEGHVSPPQGFRELQAALDASPTHSVEAITKSIGFLCRFLYTSRSPDISTIFASPELHPLVKVAVSRVEAHVELLQQVVLFVDVLDSDDLDRFLRPILAFTVLNSSSHASFGRRLHSNLASLSCAHSSRGLSIFKFLVEFIPYYPLRTTQEIGIAITSAEELVDAFETSLKKSIGRVEHARVCGLKLSESLMVFCSDLSEHGMGSSSALVLLKRSILVQRDHYQDYFHDFNSMIAPLAHMLAAAEYEHEQLLLLNMSIIFLEWKKEDGLSLLPRTVLDFPLEVLFIFPVFHVMSSPSKAVKKSAVSLLLILEEALGKSWTASSSSSSICQGGFCYSHKVGVVVHRLIQRMWLQDQGLMTWNYDSNSAHPWQCDLLHCENRSKAWLEHLKRSSVNKGEGSRSSLVSQPYGRLRKVGSFGGSSISCLQFCDGASHNPNTSANAPQGCKAGTSGNCCSFALQNLGGYRSCFCTFTNFYTAWAVVAKHLPGLPLNPKIANRLCILLRWGGMDAEAYPEASKGVLELIWEAATSKDPEYSDLWLQTRISAMQALTFYDVGYVQQNIAGFGGKLVEMLISEFDAELLHGIEGLVVKILTHEHGTRHRLQREDRVGMNKVEKLLHVLHQILFPSEGKDKAVADIPGAALLCLTFSPPARAAPKKVSSRDLQMWQSKHENALVEIAGRLQLSRNIFVALLSLQSWISFMRRWLRAKMMVFEAEDMPDIQEKIPVKAADSIFKDVCKMAEVAVPRVAENLALALGALCMVLPLSAHNVTFAASKFLLDWLCQDAHEYKQWSAAISLGLVSICLHATDWEHKYKIINRLLEVAGKGDRALVTGACGVGLGFACHDLLSGGTVSNGSHQEIGTVKQKDAELLGQILKSLMQLLSQLCPSASETLQKLDRFELVKTGNLNGDYKLPDWTGKQHENLEENLWGIAGLVIGLGNSVVAIQRAGSPALVVEITNILISWIPGVSSWHTKNLESESYAYGDISAVSLAVGSCLALSTAVNVCHKMELMDEGLDSLVNRFKIFISKITSKKHYDYSCQNVLMAACIGAGNLLSCILNQAVIPIKFEDIRNLLEAIRNTYIHSNPPIVHLGGMIGVVNAMGAGAGLITPFSQQTVDLQSRSKQKETSYMRGPILSNPVCESFSESLIQEILGVIRDSKDVQLRNSAGWALSFLRNAYWSRDQSLHQAMKVVHSDFGSYISPVSQSFPEESTVWRLCSLLLDPMISETGPLAPNTIISMLRCLEKAPRLPVLDWGGLVRRFMRYKDHTSQHHLFSFPNNKTRVQSYGVREECVHFSFVHAEHIPSLLTFVDELCELSRFLLLESALQSVLLLHMVDMPRIFSQSRMEKFFNDIMEFFSMQAVSKAQDQEAAEDSGISGSLKISFWKSLHKCLTEGSTDTAENYVCYIEKCMEILFQLLPLLPLKFSEICHSGSRSVLDEEEWSEAINCLMSAPKTWLLDFLQVKTKASIETEEASVTVKKVILAKARLVSNTYIPPLELGKARSYLLNDNSDGIWRLLMEVAAALCHMPVDVKRQWLLDTIETSCITRYPSTALRFLGLLASSWSPYGPCLILDPISVLQDLPLTLASLFVDNNWSPILDLFIHKWLSLIERIYNWLTCLEKGEYTSATDSIERSEQQVSTLILDVMQRACIALKDHLSFDTQFKLIGMRIL